MIIVRTEIKLLIQTRTIILRALSFKKEAYLVKLFLIVKIKCPK